MGNLLLMLDVSVPWKKEKLYNNISLLMKKVKGLGKRKTLYPLVQGTGSLGQRIDAMAVDKKVGAQGIGGDVASLACNVKWARAYSQVVTDFSLWTASNMGLTLLNGPAGMGPTKRPHHYAEKAAGNKIMLIDLDRPLTWPFLFLRGH